MMNTKQYLNLHKFEQERHEINEYNLNNLTEKNINMAEYIHDNISKMGEIEMMNIHAKIIDIRKIKNDLLKYEMLNLDLGIKLSTLDECKTFVTKYLKRYHLHTGGFLCEDSDWTIHTSLSNVRKYKLKENELIFENSIKDIHKYDTQLTKYFAEILQFFKRHMNDNINIKYYLIKHSDKICWIVLKLVDNNHDV